MWPTKIQKAAQKRPLARIKVSFPPRISLLHPRIPPIKLEYEAVIPEPEALKKPKVQKKKDAPKEKGIVLRQGVLPIKSTLAPACEKGKEFWKSLLLLGRGKMWHPLCNRGRHPQFFKSWLGTRSTSTIIYQCMEW